MKAKSWGKYVIAYGMWAVFIALGVLFMIISRTALSDSLTRFYVQDNFQRSKEAQLFNQVYFFGGGLLLFILVLVVEEYFKTGAAKGRLFKRIARVIGIEILLIWAAGTANAALQGFSTLVVLALLLEFALGAFLIVFGFIIRPKAIQSSKKNE